MVPMMIWDPFEKQFGAFSSIAKTKLLLSLDVNVDGFSAQSCDKCGCLLDEDKCHIYYDSCLYCWLYR